MKLDRLIITAGNFLELLKAHKPGTEVTVPDAVHQIRIISVQAISNRGNGYGPKRVLSKNEEPHLLVNVLVPDDWTGALFTCTGPWQILDPLPVSDGDENAEEEP